MSPALPPSGPPGPHQRVEGCGGLEGRQGLSMLMTVCTRVVYKAVERSRTL